MVFTPDEEYILYITQTLVRHLHIIWIGVSALGFDFYMGPGLNYFLVPFMWLFKGDPIVWGIITSVCGLVTIGLLYWFGSKIFDRKTGLITALIYGFSALIVFYDQQPYPTGVPLLSLLMLISIYQTRYCKKWWIVFAFLYGLVFHIHLSLALVLFVAIYWAVTHPKTWDIKTVIFSACAFLVVISPLIGFDYFHKFSNVTAPFRVIAAIHENKNNLNLSNRFIVLGKTVSKMFYLDPGKSNSDEILYPCNTLIPNNSTKLKLPIVLIVSVLGGVYLFEKQKKKDESKKLFLIYSLAFLMPFIFLSSIGSVEYYLLGLFPVFILMISCAAGYLYKNFKFFVCVLLILFAGYNFFVVINANGDYGLATKKKIVRDVMGVVGNSTFELSENGGACQGTAGWGYLFSVYGRAPDKNVTDKQFSWLIPIGDAKNTKYSVIINESRYPKNYKNFDYKFTEGGFTSFVFIQK